MSAARTAAAPAPAPRPGTSAAGGGTSPATLVSLGPRPHRIFILPTRQGYAFALVLCVMLLGAANYNNSLAYVLTFLLGSLALVSMLHTHRNLAGLRLAFAAQRPVFCGANARFHLTIDNRGQPARHAVTVRWTYDAGESDAPAAVETYAVEADTIARHAIEVRAMRRGWQALGEVVVATRYPFGLFRAWCPLDIDTRCLVYPRPRGAQPLPRSANENIRESGLKGVGRDDFAGFRDYVPGDSPRQIHWKAAARDQGLPVKLFSGANAGDLLLRWSDVDAGRLEARLSQLCRWVVEADASGSRYGLEVPGLRLAPADGEAHRHACLRALALFEPGETS
ncbi:MAG: DUF58 domain-containing protein [Gammaproteobacteria bacterium]|nr:DUF58 domain-containing protein [Gammaproteobacteria bacterium]